MESLKKILNRNSDSSWSKPSEKERVQFLVDVMNEDEGNLDSSIYDCKKCKNKGFIYFVDERNGHYWEATKYCDCKKMRNSIIKMRVSGLEPIIKRCTFDKYEAKEDWQKKAKEKAMNFAANCESLEDKCFFIGGGVGSGKTHLCTAIVRELLLKGKSARYMLWVKDSAKLKAIVNDAEYEPALDEFRKVEVLYIDDFFKVTKDRNGNELYPTAADIRLAYEIINYRYQHRDLITIISSERYIDELEEIDSAVGSRIYEISGDNILMISKDRSKNYRFKKREVL